MTVSLAQLKTLPLGMKVSERSGQATVTAERLNDSVYVVSATCDSLERLVISLYEEIERINSIALAEEKPPEVIKEPTGFQWFQIWIGRIAVALLILILIKRRLKIN